MRIGSLFSGAGGLDMAVQAVFGGEVVWHSEIDKAASKVLAHRFPDVPNLGDITKVNWNDPSLVVDVICGGFPCQDVSDAGRAAGLSKGTRSGLWYEMARIIGLHRPKFVVIENVRGLLSATAHRDVESDDPVVGIGGARPVLRAAGAVVGTLSELGYSSRWATVTASAVGAPHRRERVFIVGTVSHTGHDAGCAEQRVEHEMQAPRLGQPSDRNRFAANADSDGLVRGAERHIVQAAGIEASQRDNADRRVLADGRDQRCANSVGDEIGVAALLPTPNASDCTGGGAHPDSREGHSRQLIDFALLAGSTAWGKYEPAIRRWEDLLGVPAPTPTELGRKGNPRLAAPFSEWLMGWPAGWVTDPAIGISRNDQLKIIGNGVVPQQAAAAIQHLLKVTL